MNQPVLEWDEKYSVKVMVIDEQHKKLFETVNNLIKILKGVPKKDEVSKIIDELVFYKKHHFATEEGYFERFDYLGAEDHKKKHELFDETLKMLVKKYGEDPITFAYKLIDFLEDWLIDHLMTEDQKYVECFTSHGLK